MKKTCASDVLLDHSENELRYLLVGHSLTGRILLVVHAENDDTIRIISARRATPREREDFALAKWWASAAGNVRLLPEDVAREFPDTKSTVAALRMVMKLRNAHPEAPPVGTRKRLRKPRAG